jgi:integrase
MAARLREDCDSNKQHRPTLDARLTHLLAFFGAKRMASIRGADVAGYRAARQRAGAANATINRELGTLAHAFALGRTLGLLNETSLNIRGYRLAESAPRAGFFERDQFDAMLAHLHHVETREVEVKGKMRRKAFRVPADDLRLACLIAYRLGWRMQSEILTLERRHVDLNAAGGMGTLSLDPGATKNDDARVVVLTPDLRAAIRDQLARLDRFQRDSGRVTRYLFTHTTGPHAGERIRDFRRVWKTACRKAGVPGRLRHDFRRTAVREMVNATVPERVAMKITGHRTRSVFDRYHIVSPGDLQRAARLMSAQTENGSQGENRGDPGKVKA